MNNPVFREYFQRHGRFFDTWKTNGAGLSVVWTVLLASCAASNYQSSVTTFADSTQKAETALVTLNQTVTQNYVDVIKRQALAKKVAIYAAPNSCDESSARCQLVYGDPATPGSDKIIPSADAQDSILLLMHGIVQYADDLKAIVQSDSGAKTSDSLAAAAGSVKTLADNTQKIATANHVPAKAAPSGVDRLAVPAGNVFAWLAGQYVDAMQVEALRSATAAARPVIDEAAALLTKLAASEQVSFNRPAADAYSAAYDAYRADRSSAVALNAWLKAAQTLDAGLQAKAGDVFSAMAKAHDNLADRLAGKNLSLADLETDLQTFASQADRLLTLVQAVQAAATPPLKTETKQ